MIILITIIKARILIVVIIKGRTCRTRNNDNPKSQNTNSSSSNNKGPYLPDARSSMLISRSPPERPETCKT